MKTDTIYSYWVGRDIGYIIYLHCGRCILVVLPPSQSRNHVSGLEQFICATRKMSTSLNRIII